MGESPPELTWGKGIAGLLEGAAKRSLEKRDRFTESSIEVGDISALLTALKQELHSPTAWVFRGQAAWDWSLRPKLGRDERQNETFELTAPVRVEGLGRFRSLRGLYLSKEKERFEEWRAEARAVLDPSVPRPSSDLEWLAIGQHYGLNTRLLDWTRNPLVGLYFAISDDRDDLRERDGALFALQGLPTVEDGAPWQSAGVRLYNPPSLVERMGRQSGLFSLHQVGDQGGSLDLVSYAQGMWQGDERAKGDVGSLAFRDLALVKIRVKAEDKHTLRQELRLLGVDEFFAFPDLGGLCRAHEKGRTWKARSTASAFFDFDY